MLHVFKFGGASVKDAAAVRNVADIVAHFSPDHRIVIIVSAMGKTTNALEEVVDAYYYQKGNAADLLNQIKEQHLSVSRELFGHDFHPVFTLIEQTFATVAQRFNHPPSTAYSYEYDQIVSLGELAATLIVSDYLNECRMGVEWLDARRLLRTDNTYREGQINWKESAKRVLSVLPKMLDNNKIIITQGFMGGTIEGFTTTLGREGSDYTAAVFANLLDADAMTVWKDVPGILSADPRIVDNAVLIPVLSYYEAIEMTYYGAHVIHPKTIKPVQNKNIPLYVRSFVKPTENGTIVQAQLPEGTVLPPVVVIKKNQLLLSVQSNDFSFVAEENLSNIYQLFAEHRIKTNLTQNAAISFSACIDNTPNRITELLTELAANYTVHKNEGLELITIRHYTPEAIAQHTQNREILLEQKSRHTIQMVVK